MRRPSHYPDNPSKLWDFFWDFTQTPRPSKQEEQISRYVKEYAKSHGLECLADNVGNLVIRVPGSPGRESEPGVIIQNHLDMVTDAVPGKKIDFSKDPIEVTVSEGYLRSVDTTLGADNGIGCCAALALIEACEDHPPLELLFTVDEETGLGGALGLDPSLLRYKKLINLDSEDWGVFYIGCAGGKDFELTGKVETNTVPANFQAFQIEIGGLLGGHSGIDIHRGRANAIKELALFLAGIRSEYSLVEFVGGKAHNIIPRDASCVIVGDQVLEQELGVWGEKFLGSLEGRFPEEFGSLKFEISEADTPSECVNASEGLRMVQLANIFPHGAHEFDWRQTSDVLTSVSNNLARFILKNGEVYFQTSCRAMDEGDYLPLVRQIEILAKQNHLNCAERVGYPGWAPIFDGELLKRAVDVYFDIHGEKPDVRAIHAGLECGILNEKLGGIESLSFGPIIQGAHSPSERVEIESVAKFWNLLIEIMKVKNIGA